MLVGSGTTGTAGSFGCGSFDDVDVEPVEGELAVGVLSSWGGLVTVLLVVLLLAGLLAERGSLGLLLGLAVRLKALESLSAEAGVAERLDRSGADLGEEAWGCR